MTKDKKKIFLHVQTVRAAKYKTVWQSLKNPEDFFRDFSSDFDQHVMYSAPHAVLCASQHNVLFVCLHSIHMD